MCLSFASIREGIVEAPVGTPAGALGARFLIQPHGSGRAQPQGNGKALQEISDTVSKFKSVRNHVAAPLVSHFTGKNGDHR
jgi:hypothetical protein